MEADAWERFDVNAWTLLKVEPVGSSAGTWLEEPGDQDRRWLHKATVIPSNGVEQGEDWSEVVSSRVGELLGVPTATTRLCTRGDRRGSLSLSVVPKGHALWEGTVVLGRAKSPGYYPHSEGNAGLDPARPEVRRPGHSLGNIRDALQGVAAPPGFGGPKELTGYDVFAGYLILDALIANPDRHEQNWAILTPVLLSGTERLAPSYDHASSLGYNVPEPTRQRCIGDTARLEAWADRGHAKCFEHQGRPPSLVAHAAAAVQLCTPVGANWWRDRLAVCTLGSVQEELRQRVIPEMSELAVTFANQVLDVNLRRLRDAICTSS